jgi:CHAD domain-containing protein
VAIRSNPIEGVEQSSHTPQTDPVELVHEARKAIKRMRALARLLRHELGEQEFKRLNGSLGAAGRRLSSARDAEVRLTTLRSLLERHPKALALKEIGRLERRLEAEREWTVEPSDREEVLRDIADMRQQLAHWNLVEHDLETMAPGLRRIYREGRHRYVRVKHERGRDAQHMHDWRKRVKSLYYALNMLGGKKSKGARGMTRRADRLGELLGEEHDLWMFCSYLEQHPEACGEDARARAKLLQRIARRRKRLRKRALELGARLYKRKPAGFMRRMKRSLAG